MDNQLREVRYTIGDVLGDYAPDYFRRRSTTTDLIIGIGGMLTAFGIAYLALRVADKRLTDVIESLVPSYGTRDGRPSPEVVPTGEQGSAQ